MLGVVTSAAMLALLLSPGAVMAHPGHDEAGGGLLAGLLHPLLGLDHLLAMLGVGLWSSQGASPTWGRSRFSILASPSSFVAAMVAGAALAIAGWTLPWIEYWVAASLLALGACLVMASRSGGIAPLAMAGLFGLAHGAAHGAELPAMAEPFAYVAGFSLSTVALLSAGTRAGKWLAERNPRLIPVAGSVLAMSGLAFLLA